ncbi:MAG: aminomethyl-transferring glycine dehydrogenase subunit GcvPA [Clostridia bacterium]|jgi:glycine dehydrogenase subunit 1|nr:aminomethyl-transferring glycine dehydrogenase subunit GcvPA [Clostridiaceae bacterium]
MNKYIPNTPTQAKEMLSALGIDSVDRLFDCIPDSIKSKNRMNLPKGLSDPDLERTLRSLAGKNKNTEDFICFIGAGAYDRYIPAVVKAILRRQEFYTAYTPYQGEASQGWLQAIFEYQSMICSLTGMEGSNASLYDGGSALAEAVTLSNLVKKKGCILVSGCLNPRYKKVLDTYVRYKHIKLSVVPQVNGITDLESVSKEDLAESGCLIIQNPNYFGCLEDMTYVSEFAKKNNLHLIVSVNPISLGILQPPGEYEADIVTGEGQELGNALSFGGPYLGFMAVSKAFIRRMPGRIVGQTKDAEGKTGYVLTMQAREQHIRREKATSNICSNQALNALAAAVYLAALGKEGIREVARLSFNKARYLYEGLIKTGLFKERFQTPFFNEFVLDAGTDPGKLQKAFLERNILFGHSLKDEFPDMENDLLIAVTEKRTKEEMDRVLEMAGDFV